MEKYGLKAHIIEKIQHIFEKYEEIENVLLYGSRAKGNYRAGSDIDLAIVAPTFTLSQLLKIEIALDDLLLPYQIDLSLYHQIENQDLIEHIKRVGVFFYVSNS